MAYKGAAGLSEEGVDRYLSEAEDRDRGTTRHPWPKKVRGKVKAAIEGMGRLEEVSDAINNIVVTDLGPGLYGKGPL